jgi:protease I
MAKIAVLVDDLFEDLEYLKPVESFKKNGHEIILIGLKEKKPSRANTVG